jgi:hypothetical protein
MKVRTAFIKGSDNRNGGLTPETGQKKSLLPWYGLKAHRVLSRQKTVVW